jgi:hypothetical protein
LLSHYAIQARQNLPDKEFRSSIPQEGLYLHPLIMSSDAWRWSLDSHVWTNIALRQCR